MQRRLAGAALGALFGVALVQGSPQSERMGMELPFSIVTRGAYLQCGTPTSIVVRWRTTLPTLSVVHYGRTLASLDSMAGSGGRSREHVVLLSGLLPNTKYFYGVGTSNRVYQAGPSNYFITAPQPGAPQTTRVWVLGDPGTDYPEQKAVRDAYERTSGSRQTDLVLTLGDNAYSRGSDAQYQKSFFEVYCDLFKHVPVWPALGNHDARSADSATESGVYYEIFTLPRQGQAGGAPSGTAAYYSFDYANAHFICLNSQDSDLASESPMLRWLRRDLAANHQDWTVAYWHHPPYSKGTHDSDDPKDNDRRMSEMRETIVPLLEAVGVDLVLCGHSHLYERSFLLHGHYGNSQSFRPDMVQSPNSHEYRKGAIAGSPGTVYVTSGSAGHATKPKDLHGLNHPAMAVSLNVPGSFVLEIQGLRLQGQFLDLNGAERDEFTIRKE
jgi:hypothetical protein